jgi:hypothetical protein
MIRNSSNRRFDEYIQIDAQLSSKQIDVNWMDDHEDA